MFISTISADPVLSWKTTTAPVRLRTVYMYIHIFSIGKSGGMSEMTVSRSFRWADVH